MTSSDGAKTYLVVWDREKTAFGANDNASYWVGYMGYPIIAALMSLDVLLVNHKLADWLAGVNWNQLNKTYKKDYDAAVEYVLDQIARRSGPRDGIKEHAEALFAGLKDLNIGRITPPGPPPKRF